MASISENDHHQQVKTIEKAKTGVTKERVQATTLEAIEKLFPPPMNGLEFLGLVLRYATIKQLTLPTFTQEQSVAVITVKNIRVLSKLIGWSYDTTHKYVALFCALGFFIKGRRQRQVELYFPLDSYAPPESLAALDNLIAEYRPKVRQSAQQVKTRFLLYFSSPQPLFEKMGVPGELQPMLQEIRQLFQHEGVDSKKQQYLLVQIARVVQRVLPGKQIETVDTTRKSLPASTYPTLPSRQPKDQSPEHLSLTNNANTPKSLPSKPETVDSSCESLPSARSALSPKKNRPSATLSLVVDSSQQKVDSFPSTTHKVVDFQHKRGDSFSMAVTEKGDFSASEVDFCKEHEETAPKSLPPKGDFSPAMERRVDFLAEGGDFSLSLNTEKVYSPDEKGDFSQKKSTPTGDFSEKVAPVAENEVDLNNLSNVNVNNIITNNLNNVNVKSLQTLAALLGTILGEDRSKWGIYVVHLKQYSQPEAIFAALVKTLSCKFSGTSLHNPPAFFLARSKEYHHTAIPVDVRQLVKQYETYSYGELVEALKCPPLRNIDHPILQTKPKEVNSSALQAIKPPPLHIAVQTDKAHMGKEEILALYKLLSQDPRMVMCKKFIFPVDPEGKRFALLLDVTISNKVRQTILYSRQEWEERSGEMRTCLNLFEDPETQRRAQNHFSSLREILTKNSTLSSVRKGAN